MALSELQKSWLTKEVLYRNLMSMNTELDNVMNNAKNKLEFLNRVTGTDLADINVPAETQTLLGQMRTALGDLIDSYDAIYAAVADQTRMM